MNAAPDGVSIYDRMWRDDADLCALLALGGARRELIAAFGAADYAQLAGLARQAAAARRRHAASVYLLPGIMGSQLGAARGAGAPADLLWLDPQDIIAGTLTRLRLPDAGALGPLGAIPFSYLALQLRLRAAGFAVAVHDYDWRQDLEVLAAEFAARIGADPAPEVCIVAHSMGGLIARRALQSGQLARVRRLVTLGTPHGGSFGAAQAIRGTYPVVRRLAALDRLHDAEFLAARVFSSFPSLHQMLPPPGPEQPLDLFDAGNWPQAGPRPEPRLLAAGRAFAARLPSAEPRCIAICGTQQRTVTGARLVDDDFHYQVSDAGDGTVPLASAQLAGSDNYYVRCEHSALPRSASVARALVELLRHGRTTRLAMRPGVRRARGVTVSDRQLRTTWSEKVDWAALAPELRRDYLNRLNQPPRQYAAVT
ncbi:MAG: hypothetical protein KGL25_09260 [Gammaproteobacteria bacterium]|nr:hypothetical protein [Gammaproteobacteria bacterium]